MKSMSSKIASNDSGKRELHPYVRPGICTMLIGITCFIASLMAYKMTSKYDQSLCEQVELRASCLAFIRNGRIVTLGLVVSGVCLLVLGILCSILSICHLIRKTVLREVEANEKLRHYCKETLKRKGTSISICDDHPQVDGCSHKPKKKFFSWSSSVTWKSFSKSILIEPEETQFQNDILFNELSKVMSQKKTIKEETPKSVPDSTYFTLPFKKRLEVEEMIKRVALEGISLCNCHKCTLCHCHLRKEQQLQSPEVPDFSALNV